MAAANSRYAATPVLTWVGADGRIISHLARRFVPPGNSMPQLSTVTVTQGDRLDLITARTLGDPLQFWRICDANDAVDPFDLTAVPGRSLRVAMPRF